MSIEDLKEAIETTEAARALLSEAVWDETDSEWEQVSAEFEALGWKSRGWGFQSPCLRFGIRRDKYPVVEVDQYYNHLYRISREEGKLIEAKEVILRGLCIQNHEHVKIDVLVDSDHIIIHRTRRFCEEDDSYSHAEVWETSSEEIVFLRELPKEVQEAARSLQASRKALRMLRASQEEAEDGLTIER